MYLAIKEILVNKRKFSLIIALIALITYLVYFLTALAYGLASSYTNGINKIKAENIFLSNKANDSIMMSMLDLDDYDKIISNSKSKLSIFPAVVLNNKNEETKEDAYIFGVSDINFYLPNEEYTISDKEVIVSDELLKKGYKIGDKLTFSNSNLELTIKGFTKNATYQTAPIVYMNITDYNLYRFNTEDGYYNAIVTKDSLEFEVPGFSNYKIKDYIKTLPGYTAQVLTFSMMIGFLIVIIAFVLGIFIYVLTIQKSKMFGVMKAQGISNLYIGKSVISQTVIICFIGSLIGLFLTILTGTMLKDKIPFAVNYLFYMGITLSFFIFPVLSGLFSVKTIVNIDPLDAIGG